MQCQHWSRADVIAKARQLRRNMTRTEHLLWERLRKKQLGIRFRRQHPIGPFVVDFYAHQSKLVIEIDGDYHRKKQQKELDKLRESQLIAAGLKVLRYTDDQVISNLEGVVEEIRNNCQNCP
ncbi:MAG: endonuclease domain-containing protein [Saprospiraceae bacterium]|nr:endonuclease domain-containing protein [Saprospiraceae bacterium]